MAEFIKVNGVEYPATLIYNYKDRNWDMRETQTVHLTMPYAQAVEQRLPRDEGQVRQRRQSNGRDRGGRDRGGHEHIQPCGRHH